MAVGHAAAELVDELAHGDAGRRQLDARVLDPARDREAARPLAAAPSLPREPFRPLLDDVAHPEQRLDVVDERRPPEQPDLRGIGRLVARQAALTLDALEHRRFLAADIGTGAA